MTIDLQDYFAGISAFAAILCALWSYVSYRTSKKALQIASRERDAKDANVDSHLIEIFSSTTSEGNRYVTSQVMFTNKSEISDSISRTELIITYKVDDVLTNVVIAATSDKPHLKSLSGTAIKTPPFTLSPRETITPWLSFKLPARIDRTKKIEKYEIEAVFASGAKCIETSYLAGEVFDE